MIRDGLLVASGSYFADDGEVRGFDPDAGVGAVLWTEAELQADVHDLAGVPGGVVALLTPLDGDGPARAECWTLDGGRVAAELEAGWLVDAEPMGDEVAVGARSSWTGDAASAVYAVDPVSCTVRTLADRLALEPYALTWVP